MTAETFELLADSPFFEGFDRSDVGWPLAAAGTSRRPPLQRSFR